MAFNLYFSKLYLLVQQILSAKWSVGDMAGSKTGEKPQHSWNFHSSRGGRKWIRSISKIYATLDSDRRDKINLERWRGVLGVVVIVQIWWPEKAISKWSEGSEKPSYAEDGLGQRWQQQGWRSVIELPLTETWEEDQCPGSEVTKELQGRENDQLSNTAGSQAGWD